MLSFLLSQPRACRRARLAAAHAALRRATICALAPGLRSTVTSMRVADERALPVLFASMDGLRRAAASLRAARLQVAAAELGEPHAA